VKLGLAFLSFGLSALSGCSAPEAHIAPPHQYIVLLDLSMSRSRAMQKDGSVFLDRLSRALNFGDRIAILQVQQAGLLDHPEQWTHELAKPFDASYVTSQEQKMLAGEQESVRDRVKHLSKTVEGQKVQHTDLLTTIHLAGEYAREHSSWPTTIILLSDMLQSTRDMEMNRLQRMPAKGWLASQGKLGLVPSLPKACVLVIGADPTTSEGLSVREFWQSYFSAAGAKLMSQNYRSTAPTTGVASCD